MSEHDPRLPMRIRLTLPADGPGGVLLPSAHVRLADADNGKLIPFDRAEVIVKPDCLLTVRAELVLAEIHLAEPSERKGGKQSSLAETTDGNRGC